METTLKLTAPQAILLSNSLQSNPEIIREIHTNGSKRLDKMLGALNESGSIQDLVNAIGNNGHEFVGKLQDTKFLNAEDVESSKALQSAFANIVSQSSSTEDFATVHAAFTALNDIENNEGINFEGFGKNEEEDQILNSDNPVLKVLYETITKDPEFLRVKTDKFLTDTERQEKIAEITLGYLNPDPLNFSISEMAERMTAIEEVRNNPVDIDQLLENIGRLRESTAFLSKINENGSTESLFADIEAVNREITEMANNSVEETRGIDRVFAYDYDKKMTEAVTSNPEQVTVAPDADNSQEEGHKEGHKI